MDTYLKGLGCDVRMDGMSLALKTPFNSCCTPNDPLCRFTIIATLPITFRMMFSNVHIWVVTLYISVVLIL
uniref:Uncharacterized protein n=1 Tax=Anguilla anguilla TaxID=7936 RepID=A0A0E9WVX5_ANGAN